MALKKNIILAVKAAVAVIAVFYLFKSGYLKKESFITLLRPENILLILISCLAFIVTQMLASVRLMLLLRTISFHIRFRQSFRLTIIGNFFNIVIPGTIGGDLVKGFYLIKDEEQNKGRSSGVVITDRLLGLLAMMGVGGLAILYLSGQDTARLSAYANELYIMSIATWSILLLFILFLFLGNNRFVREKFKSLFAFIFSRKGIYYSIADGFGVLVKNPRVMIKSLLLSFLIQIISLAGLLNLGNVVSSSAVTLSNLIALTAVSSIVMLLGVVPVTPGNIGWTELLAALGWSALGSPAGAEIFVYWRIVTVLCSLPGGVLYLLKSGGLKEKRDNQIVKTPSSELK